MSISLVEFTKAIDSLQEALGLYAHSKPGSIEQKAFRDSCIQRFEYCIELAWKTSMRILGSSTAAAKPAVREMARNGLISDPGAWIEFVNARNNTSHTYNEKAAVKVFSQILIFHEEVKKLRVELQKHLS